MAYHRYPRRGRPRSSASSTPTARACGCTTAASCPPSCRRRCGNEAVTVFGDGSQTRSFCYVERSGRRHHRLMLSKENMPTNIGNPAEMTIKQIAETIIEMNRLDEPHHLPAAARGRPKVRQPDITRARTLLGWEPKVDLREGLTKTIEGLSAPRSWSYDRRARAGDPGREAPLRLEAGAEQITAAAATSRPRSPAAERFPNRADTDEHLKGLSVSVPFSRAGTATRFDIVNDRSSAFGEPSPIVAPRATSRSPAPSGGSAPRLRSSTRPTRCSCETVPR